MWRKWNHILTIIHKRLTLTVLTSGILYSFSIFLLVLYAEHQWFSTNLAVGVVLQMHGMIYLAVFTVHESYLNITMANYSKIIWIYWMFYDHHSFLAILDRWGWLMRMQLAWKKSQNTLCTSKRLHGNKTQITLSAGKGLDAQLCHYWELQTRKRAGEIHTQALNI